MRHKESDLEILAGVPIKLPNEILQRYIAPIAWLGVCVNGSDWGAMVQLGINKTGDGGRSSCDSKQKAAGGRNLACSIALH